jgi:hypothetical protein
MKMDAQKFINDITEENYETNLVEISWKQVITNPQSSLSDQLAFMEEQINLGRLASSQLVVKNEDISFFLQNGIVNLPYRYDKNISKMMSGDGDCELHVYMFVESPDVNRSKLRIDELALQDDFNNDQHTLQTLTDWMQTQLTSIEANRNADATETTEN